MKKKIRRNCRYCNIECNRPEKFYCNNNCQQKHRQKVKLELWKQGLDVGWCGKTISLKDFIRRYIIDKYSNKCSKCGWNEIHPVTKRVPLEINHIDGNAKNCQEDNLEALCPNCHALTVNFRALNKNSPRNRRNSL